MKRTILFLLLVIPSLGIYAQSEKSIKTHKISQRIESLIDYEEGLTDKRTSEMQAFDKEGRLIEFKDWTKDGKIKEWLKYTYSAEGKLLTETVLDAKGKVEFKMVTEYKDGLKVKKSYYDGKERLIKEKLYEYKYFK